MIRAKLGSGERFKAVAEAARKSGAKNPNAVAAAVGIAKYGKEKMAKMAAAGRKRANLAESGGGTMARTIGAKNTKNATGLKLTIGAGVGKPKVNPKVLPKKAKAQSGKSSTQGSKPPVKIWTSTGVTGGMSTGFSTGIGMGLSKKAKVQSWVSTGVTGGISTGVSTGIGKPSGVTTGIGGKLRW